MYPGSNLDSNYSTELRANVNFRQLIDMAVVVPSRLNFYALHWLLLCFAEKLNILEERIDFRSFRNTSPQECVQHLPFVKVRPSCDAFDEVEMKNSSKRNVKGKPSALKTPSSARSKVPEESLDQSEEFKRVINHLNSLASSPKCGVSRKTSPRKFDEDVLPRSITDSFDAPAPVTYPNDGNDSLDSFLMTPRSNLKVPESRLMGGSDIENLKKATSSKMKDKKFGGKVGSATRQLGGDDEPADDSAKEVSKPEDKPADEKPPEDKPEAEKSADSKPEEKPEDKAEDKPEEKDEEKPTEKPEEKPEEKTDDKEDKPEEKPEDKPEEKPEEKVEKEEEKAEDKKEMKEKSKKESKKDEKKAEKQDKKEEKPAEVDDEKSAAPTDSKVEPSPEYIERLLDGETSAPIPKKSSLMISSHDKSLPSSSAESSIVLGESLSGEGAEKSSKRNLGDIDISNLVTHSELDIRLVGVDTIMKSPLFAEDTHRGLTIMKDQLELSMEQLKILSAFILDSVKDEEKRRVLAILLSKLIEIRNENVYIPGHLRLDELLMKELSIGEEQISESELVTDAFSFICGSELGEEEGMELSDQTLYRRPSSIFREEIAKIKADICTLYNKVTELTTAILELDCTKISERVDEINDKVTKLWNSHNVLSANHEVLKIKVNDLSNGLEETNKFCQYLDETKANLTDMEMRLAQKGDITLVARKVSHEKLDDTYNQLERKNCELRKIVVETERNIMDIIDNLRYTLGIDHFESLLRQLRREIQTELCDIRNIIQKIIEDQNACVAAGAKVNVLENVKCLSCNTPCIMRNQRLPGPGSAHPSKGLGPIVTYHISTLRKDTDDHVGYACQNAAAVPAPQERLCPPRHAGGKHTAYTRKEFVEKVYQKRVVE